MAPSIVPSAQANIPSRRAGTVAKTEMRSITVRELDEVVKLVDAKARDWKGRRPAVDSDGHPLMVDKVVDGKPVVEGGEVVRTQRFDEVALTPETFNLHDCNTHIIKPSTAEFQCSFAELFCAGERQPDFFVSHSWNGTVKSFVACLRQFCLDRKLDPSSTTFWVCAYCNNQWNLAKEVKGLAPKDSSFHAALMASRGTVAVMDAEQGLPISRVWCVYEAFLALTKHGDGGYDSYAASASAPATGITAGTAPIDELRAEGMPGGAVRNKARREAAWPRKLMDSAQGFDVRRAGASVEDDRRRILAEIDADGAADAVNATVAANYRVPQLTDLLTSAPGSAEARGLDSFFDDLRRSQLRALGVYIDTGKTDEARSSWWTRLWAQLLERGPKPNEQLTSKLVASVPATLTRLELTQFPLSTLDGLCHAPPAGGVGGGAAAPAIRRLAHLALRTCKLTDESCEAIRVAMGGQCTLEHLDLSNNRITDAGVLSLAKMLGPLAARHTLRSLSLSQNFISGRRRGCLAELAGALTLHTRLRALHLHYNRVDNDGALALARALRILPEFELLKLKHNALRDNMRACSVRGQLLPFMPTLRAQLDRELPPRAGVPRYDGVEWYAQHWMHKLKLLACLGYGCVTLYLFASATIWQPNMVATHRLFFGYDQRPLVLSLATLLVAFACAVAALYTLVFTMRDARLAGELCAKCLPIDLYASSVWDYRELHPTAFQLMDTISILLFVAIALVAAIGIMTFQAGAATGQIQAV